jgi:hypothetical protein
MLKRTTPTIIPLGIIAREVGELIAFAGIGLLGAKCIEELRRPTKNPGKNTPRTPRARHGERGMSY